MELSMKLYLNDKEFEVPLQTKLTPYLHDKVTPLLNGLANSRGGNSAAEQWILEEAFSNPALAQLIDLQKGANAFDNLLATNEGQQLVKLSFLKVRQRLFEVINVDAETMPLILAFAKECIDASKVAYVEESALCESYLENLVVFNDPDDDEYEDEEDDGANYYLGEDLSKNYWIYKALAKGDAGTYLRLYYETSRVDVVQLLAYTITFAKERKKMERRKNVRRY